MEIILNGVKYKSGKAKAKMWRELSQFDDNKKGIKFSDFADVHAEMIAKTFANAEVTAEKILEEYDIDDLVPLYREVSNWFFGLIHAKMGKIPNEKVAAE